MSKLKGTILSVEQDSERANVVHVSILIREGNVYDFLKTEPPTYTLKPDIKITIEDNKDE